MLFVPVPVFVRLFVLVFVLVFVLGVLTRSPPLCGMRASLVEKRGGRFPTTP